MVADVGFLEIVRRKLKPPITTPEERDEHERQLHEAWLRVQRIDERVRLIQERRQQS